MVRFYSPVDTDDIVLMRQTMSRDSAFHGTPPFNRCRDIERRPMLSSVPLLHRVYVDSCPKLGLIWHNAVTFEVFVEEMPLPLWRHFSLLGDRGGWITTPASSRSRLRHFLQIGRSFGEQASRNVGGWLCPLGQSTEIRSA
jgi:hypothetical protein